MPQDRLISTPELRKSIAIRHGEKLPPLGDPKSPPPIATQPISTAPQKRRKVVFKRLLIQLTFITIHVALIKFAIPNLLWAVLGLLFWGGLIYAASRSGRWVCATFCWLGGIQDLFYSIAKKRVSFNPKITQYATLFFLVVWVPIAWFFHSSAITDLSESPLHNPLSAGLSVSGLSLEEFVIQFGHFLVLIVVGLSVAVFGSRGACHYFCPFGIAVGYFKSKKLSHQLKTGV